LKDFDPASLFVATLTKKPRTVFYNAASLNVGSVIDALIQSGRLVKPKLGISIESAPAGSGQA
jgi:hypothetical protein